MNIVNINKIHVVHSYTKQENINEHSFNIECIKYKYGNFVWGVSTTGITAR